MFGSVSLVCLDYFKHTVWCWELPLVKIRSRDRYVLKE